MIKKHGISGYRNGCRCDVCKSANTVRVANRRARRKSESEPSYAASSRPTVVQISKPAVTLSPEPKSVTAQDLARQDLAEILSALDSDPEWRGVVEEAVNGEIAALRNLIDSHNRSARMPRLACGYSQGAFWAGTADDYPEEATVTSDSPSQSLVIPLPTQTRAVPRAVQLPQSAPLARPRNARGVAPTVPAIPGRTANTTHHRTPDTATPGDAPTWG